MASSLKACEQRSADYISDCCYFILKNPLWLLVGVLILFVLMGLVLPPKAVLRDPSRRASCLNNIRQILIAIHNFESANGYFPTDRIVTTPDGTPLRNCPEISSSFEAIEEFRLTVSRRRTCRNEDVRLRLTVKQRYRELISGQCLRHSWRISILPEIEEGHVYELYDFIEPWNGPNNSKLADKMSQVWRCPLSRRTNLTNDRLVNGPVTVHGIM